MSRFFEIFFSAKSTNPYIVLVCLLVAGLFQGIGLASLVPLFQVADGNLDPANPITAVFLAALARFELEPDYQLFIVVVVLGMVLKACFLILALIYVGYAVAEVATDLRARLIRGLLDARWQYYVRQPLGSIANAMSLEAQRGADAYAMVAHSISYGVLTIIYIVLAILVSWQNAFLVILLGCVMALVLAIFVRIARRAGIRQTVDTRGLITELSDMLAGIKPLKAMARHGRFTTLFETQIRALKRALRHQVIAREMPKALEEPLIVISLGFGFFVARSLWGTPITEFFVVGLLIGLTISSISHIQKSLLQAAVDESAYNAVQNMIKDIEAHPEHFKSGGRPPRLMNGCAFENVNFSYGHRRVLDQINIEVPAGELTVITGDSGAGKTTIIDLLIGLHRPDSGQVLIDGVSLDELDVEQWRSMVGYVPQELVLFHNTIRNNVTLGDPSYSDAQVHHALDMAGLSQFIMSLPQGLDTVVGERGLRTSGGQRQRIALARAFVHRPKLLILDEVTSALDPETESEICKNVRALTSKGDEGLTVLAITHRPAWCDAADRVLHL